VLIKEGDKVTKGQNLVVIEAMKMETVIIAAAPGTVESVYVKEGQRVKTGELLARIK
jgi:pyruvate carboxylase